MGLIDHFVPFASPGCITDTQASRPLEVWLTLFQKGTQTFTDIGGLASHLLVLALKPQHLRKGHRDGPVHLVPDQPQRNCRSLGEPASEPDCFGRQVSVEDDPADQAGGQRILRCHALTEQQHGHCPRPADATRDQPRSAGIRDKLEIDERSLEVGGFARHDDIRSQCDSAASANGTAIDRRHHRNRQFREFQGEGREIFVEDILVLPGRLPPARIDQVKSSAECPALACQQNSSRAFL